MTPFVVRSVSSLKGQINLSGDKSISHRAIILSSLSSGLTRINNFPSNKDCLETLGAFAKLGIKFKKEKKDTLLIIGKGLFGLRKPKGPIFVGESGTTLRLLLGVLAGQDFEVKLIAGSSLSKRPMRRVTEPLRSMGAKIRSRIKEQRSKMEEFAPIVVRGGALKPIAYRMPVASAQVKSAILLAGLYANGKTVVTEPVPTRDHTERMLKSFKAGLKASGNKIVIKGNKGLVSPKDIYVPGDISSAAFFVVLAAISRNSEICLRNISLNPGRGGIITVLKRMNADIRVTSSSLDSARGRQVAGGEPMGDVIVKSSRLKGVTINKKEVPSLIDELPILMVAASLARGRSIFKGVQELRVKETDRIKSMTENLLKMGADIKVIETGHLEEHIVIKGVECLGGAKVKSFGDHRTAMSMAIAGLAAEGATYIDDVSCIKKSFPEFLRILKRLTR